MSFNNVAGLTGVHKSECIEVYFIKIALFTQKQAQYGGASVKNNKKPNSKDDKRVEQPS